MAITAQPQIFYNGAWHTPPNIADPAMTIQQGYTDRVTRRPARATFRIDNSDDTWRPSSPTAPYYVSGGRNLPIGVPIESTVRFWGEASGWTPDQTGDFVDHGAGVYSGLRYVDVEAQGVLRRIGRWDTLSAPPMTNNALGFTNNLGVWPLDDDTGANGFTNAAGGPITTFSNFELNQADHPNGANASVKVDTNALATFLCDEYPATVTGFQFGWSMKLAALPPNGSPATFFLARSLYAGGGTYWFKLLVDGSFHVQLYDNGVAIMDNTVTFGGADPTNWTDYRMKVSISGTTVKLEFAWYESGDDTVFGITYTVTGQQTQLNILKIDTTRDAGALNGTLYSTLYAVQNTTDDLQSFAALQAFNGYENERAADRFTRLCTENGIASVVVGDPDQTVTMGVQQSDTFVNLLDEIQTTEDALIYDRTGDGIGLALRTRRSRYNQDPAVTLAFGTDIIPPMDEAYDDQQSQNVITIKNRDGRTLVAADNVSAMGTLNPPAGIGVYKASYDTNIQFDNNITQAAQHYLNRGTLPQSRYPNVTIDLGAAKANGNTALLTAVQAVTIGDRIVVTGRDADDIDLQVIGWDEAIGTDTWTITFTCIPNTLFQVGAEDDTSYALAARAQTLQANVTTTTATSLSVGTTWDVTDTWSTAVDFDILIGGERMTVTAATTPVLSAGVWTQTLTVVRAVNGVHLTHSTGDAIQVAQPYREAW